MVDEGKGTPVPVTLSIAGLDSLITTLGDAGYEVSGPVVVDGVIAPEPIGSVDDLPLGWTDEQAGGHYRLRRRDDRARFGYAVGPRSWKDTLHPARSHVWSIDRVTAAAATVGAGADGADGAGTVGGTPVELRVRVTEPEPTRRAFVGVRPCELAAIAKQDRVLLHGPHPDPSYGANRADNLLIVVNCGTPAATCFCASMGTGPGISAAGFGSGTGGGAAGGAGFDLALTELIDDLTVEPRYVVEVGSERGAELLAALPDHAFLAIPDGGGGLDDRGRGEAVVAAAAAAQTRRVEVEGIKELVYDRLESPRWEQVAERCLSCANCTLACPTCFCTDLQDVTDLGGDHTDRWRVWDSCFSLDYSQLGPTPQRASVASRYRQWLSHKVATWHDQFGESGCVGCGRCITWCPVGIDLTEELAALRSEAS